MDEFNNYYLCPNCDEVGEITSQPITCIACHHSPCPIAKHIPRTSRNKWVEHEAASKSWRRDKTLDRKFKHHDTDLGLSKEVSKVVKQIFQKLSEHHDTMDAIFPHFMEDYERSTGKRNKQEETSKRRRLTKQGSLRGALYEAALLKICDLFTNIERCPNRIDSNSERYNFHPDGWYLSENERIPIEFKTVKKGNFVASKMDKYVKQSRKHGWRSKRASYNQSGYSILIVCSPEERKFGSVLLDSEKKKTI